MAIATDGCNVIGRLSFQAQNLEAKILSLVSVHNHAYNLSLLLYCCRFVQYGIRNCESTLLQLWKCFTVKPLRSVCLVMHQTTMKTKGRQLQRACKTRWLSSEATVRAMSEILAFWAALEWLSGNKNDSKCVVSLRLIKTKISSWYVPFVNIGTSPDRIEQSFSGGIY